TLHRRFEVFDDRYFEGPLLQMAWMLADAQLPEFIEALGPYSGDLERGGVTYNLVDRLIQSGQGDVARRAFALPTNARQYTETREKLAPLLGEQELEEKIQIAWKLAEEDMKQGEQFAAYRFEQWATLIRLSAKEHRPPRLEKLEALIARLPPSVCTTSQDNL